MAGELDEPGESLRFPWPRSFDRVTRSWSSIVGPWHRRISTAAVRRGWLEGLPRYAPLIRRQTTNGTKPWFLAAMVPRDIPLRALQKGRLDGDELVGGSPFFSIGRYFRITDSWWEFASVLLVIPAQAVDLLDFEVTFAMEEGLVTRDSRADQSRLPSDIREYDADFSVGCSFKLRGDLLPHMAFVIGGPSSVALIRVHARIREAHPSARFLVDRLVTIDGASMPERFHLLFELNTPEMTRAKRNDR